MASAYSLDYNRHKTESAIDLNLFGKMLLAMQGKYDKNVDALNKEIGSVSGIQLANKNAQEYLDNQINTRIKNIERTLGNPAFASEFNKGVNQVRSAIDDKIVNEYAGTLVQQNIIKDAKRAEYGKNPDRYNEKNLAYSLKDVNAWANNKERAVGTSFRGNSRYIPYTDLSEIQKKIDDMPALKGVSVTLNSAGNFTYIKDKKEVRLGAQVEQAMDMLIAQNPNYEQQLKINGWAKFQGAEDDKVLSNFDTYLTNNEKRYTDLANSYKSMVDGAMDGKKIKGGYSSDDINRNSEAVAYYLSKAAEMKQSREVLASDKYTVQQKRAMAEKDFALLEMKSSTANAMAYNRKVDSSFVTDSGGLAIHKEQRADARKRAELEVKAANDDRQYQLDLIKAYNNGDINATQYAQSGGNPINIQDDLNAEILETEVADIESYEDVENAYRAEYESMASKMDEIATELNTNYGMNIPTSETDKETKKEYLKNLYEVLTNDTTDDDMTYVPETTTGASGKSEKISIEQRQIMLKKLREYNEQYASMRNMSRAWAEVKAYNSEASEKNRIERYEGLLNDPKYSWFGDKDGNYSIAKELDKIQSSGKPYTNNVLNILKKHNVDVKTKTNKNLFHSPKLSLDVVRMGIFEELDYLKDNTPAEIQKALDLNKKEYGMGQTVGAITVSVDSDNVIRAHYNGGEGKVIDPAKYPRANALINDLKPVFHQRQEQVKSITRGKNKVSDIRSVARSGKNRVWGTATINPQTKKEETLFYKINEIDNNIVVYQNVRGVDETGRVVEKYTNTKWTIPKEGVVSNDILESLGLELNLWDGGF